MFAFQWSLTLVVNVFVLGFALACTYSTPLPSIRVNFLPRPKNIVPFVSAHIVYFMFIAFFHLFRGFYIVFIANGLLSLRTAIIAKHFYGEWQLHALQIPTRSMLLRLFSANSLFQLFICIGLTKKRCRKMSRSFSTTTNKTVWLEDKFLVARYRQNRQSCAMSDTTIAVFPFTEFASSFTFIPFSSIVYRII